MRQIMLTDFNKYISRNIRLFYRRRLFSPIMFLVLLAALWMIFPLGQVLSPEKIPADATWNQVYEDNTRYCSTTLNNLHFTGYTKGIKDKTTGYFYYCKTDSECLIVLLSPELCDEGLPTIEEISINGKLVKGGDTLATLYAHLADDLEWTQEGILKEMPSFYLSSLSFNTFTNVLLFSIYFIGLIYAVLSIIAYCIYIRFPFLSPSITNLVVYGNPKKMLEEAEEELATLPQLATEDMFITEHYFIMSSAYGNAIIPIKEILWIYKYSTLHKLLWYHFSISYTLHISAKKHIYIHSPKNAKSDIDGIIDYLAEANHDILVGFSEKNRLQVQTLQGKAFHIEKLHAIFHRK